MKHVALVLPNLPTGQNAKSLAVLPRQNPLGEADFLQIEKDIEQNASRTEQPIYGSLVTRDKSGEIVSREFDRIGTRVVFSGFQNIPVSTLQEIQRPATMSSIIYHLTRLAVHRRHADGPEALGVRVSDLASDLRGVSEWAIVSACRDLRKFGRFFPTNEEILKAVAVYTDQISSFLRPERAEKPTMEAREQHDQIVLPKAQHNWETMSDEDRRFFAEQVARAGHPVITSAMRMAYSVPDGVDLTIWSNTAPISQK